MGYYDKDPQAEIKKEKNIPEWVGHPEAGGGRTALEKDVRVNLKDWELLFSDSKDDPCYDYDDVVLLQRIQDGMYLVLRTSGCSCPSPNETWGEIASGTLQEVYKAIQQSLNDWKVEIPNGEEHIVRLKKFIEAKINA